MCADVKEIQPGAAHRLQSKLREKGNAVFQHRVQSILSETGPVQLLDPLSDGSDQTPSHLSPTSGIRSHSTLQSPTHQFGTSGQTPAVCERSSAPPIANPSLQYLLLCVNTKRLIALEHIDVTPFRNDEYLFNDIREGYNRVRRQNEWNLSHLVPSRFPVPFAVRTISLVFALPIDNLAPGIK
jgi:hypothetical protein